MYRNTISPKLAFCKKNIIIVCVVTENQKTTVENWNWYNNRLINLLLYHFPILVMGKHKVEIGSGEKNV